MAEPDTPAAVTAAEPGRKRSGGTLTMVAAVLLGAGLVSLSALLVWGRAEYQDSLRGVFQVSANGSKMRPELIPLMLATVAGLAAAMATKGIIRRVIGAGITMVGLIVAVQSVIAIFRPPVASLADLRRPADLLGEPITPWWPPLIAAVGGLLVALAGVLIVLGGKGTGLGRRFDRADPRPVNGTDSRTAATAPAAPVNSTDQRVAAELAAQQLWSWLDADTDPTVSSTPVAKPPPQER